MWFRTDDRVLHHAKFRAAARYLGGRHAFARCATLWLAGGTYAAEANHSGVIPREVVVGFAQFVEQPLKVAEALVEARAPGYTAGLWDRQPNGDFAIHQFNDYNPNAAQVEHQRERNRGRQHAFRSRTAQSA